MTKIQSPHDRLFKAAMTDKRVAREFLETHLPAEILKIVALNNLNLQKESYIDEELKLSMTDIVFQTTFSNKPGYLYMLIEHQSTPDEMMPFRIYKYIFSIIPFTNEKKVFNFC